MKKVLNFITIIFTIIMFITSCTKNVDKVEETSVTDETTVSGTKELFDELSNSVFSIKFPDRFEGMYLTKVVKGEKSADDFIEVYDKAVRDSGYNGLLFAICVYSNPADWAGGPFEKVGELKVADGKIYDVLIGYPTEAQCGYDETTGEMLKEPDSYKEMYDARYEIAQSVESLSGEKVSYGSGKKGEDLYKDVLAKHLKALDESWDSTKLEEENMSPMYNVIKASGEDVLAKVGFAYHDVDKDGVDELLVGELADGDYKGVIYDIYTMVDRKPAHVVSGWDRNRYFAIESGMLCNEWSDSAFSSGYTIADIAGNSTELNFQLALKYDTSEDETKPWYIAYSKNGDEYEFEAISEEQFNDMLSRFNKYIRFDYTPFSTLK